MEHEKVGDDDDADHLIIDVVKQWTAVGNSEHLLEHHSVAILI